MGSADLAALVVTMEHEISSSFQHSHKPAKSIGLSALSQYGVDRKACPLVDYVVDESSVPLF